ncbi:Cellulase (glycosyl hydrolase family 5) [Duganella sacchari]|uniref:Cellulase (Glycosyl hydrolase family 5) n=1 Tax=Duganella sacchari TaxID=551987 RepID=A0A1M7R059_9BURK|nr:cellulase family glycosylhydrolase [Duganella sacchari]SHN38029.1 Cellulase (glycosyl hydrolase family 5) [Duganella sacchari]
MKTIKKLLLSALLGMALTASAADFKAGTGVFLLNGKTFYGVGVNYQDAFLRHVESGGKDVSWKAGLATLKTYNIPFIRINAIGFWPENIQKNYMANPTQFYARLDEFMKECAAQNIGVIMDIFWNFPAFSDMLGERVPAWGDTNSKTRVLMRKITTEMVTRYKDNPALWGWEFANEATALMDLPASLNNYQWIPRSSTAPARTAADNFTVATIMDSLADFTRTVRAIDKTHPIFSGNDRPRNNAYHLPTKWDLDSPTQFSSILSRDNNVADTVSLHLYPYGEFAGFGVDTVNPSVVPGNFNNIIVAALARSRQVDSTGKLIDPRPLFIGEFGTSDKDLGAAVAKSKFYEMTSTIIASRVPLSAAWVFDWTAQEGTYNITATNSRKYQLERLSEMNLVMKTWK